MFPKMIIYYKIDYFADMFVLIRPKSTLQKHSRKGHVKAKYVF